MGGRGSGSGGGSKITIHGVKVDMNSMQSINNALEKLDEKVIDLNYISQGTRGVDAKGRHKARESLNHLLARRRIVLDRKLELESEYWKKKQEETIRNWTPTPPKKELKYHPTLGEVRRGKKFIREVLTRMGVK